MSPVRKPAALLSWITSSAYAWMISAIVAFSLIGCDKQTSPKRSIQRPSIQFPDPAVLDRYNGLEHGLDKCINDGTMWRASIDPSSITGSSVECLIPFDDEDYKDGDLIPNYYKWVYDRYVESESKLKGLVAANLLELAKTEGVLVEYGEEPTPDDILRQFNKTMIFILNPKDKETGHVLITTSKDKMTFEVHVSVDPIGIIMGNELIAPTNP